MSRKLLAVVITLLVFGAGLATGIWIQRTQPIPPPPMGLMGEIHDVPLASGRPFSPPPPPDGHGGPPPDLRAEIERLKPAIEEFRSRVEPLRTEFKEKLEALLTPEQKARLAHLSERPNRQNFNGAPGEPVSHPHNRLHDPVDSMFPIVVISNTLERLTAELNLTPEQVTRVRELLQERRTKFLELVDKNPPPSLRLGRLAPLVGQLTDAPTK